MTRIEEAAEELNAEIARYLFELNEKVAEVTAELDAEYAGAGR